MEWRWNKYRTAREAVNAKTNGMADEILHPPVIYNEITNLDIAASWIRQYVSAGTHITIIGDYDVDGISATAELCLALYSIGAKNIHVRMPRRLSEGYGVSEKIVDELPCGSVMITVDNGIAANEAIKRARNKGIVTIVIDHHLPRIESGSICLPEADLIVDPKVDHDLISKGGAMKTQFTDFCGAGIVFKLAGMLVSNEYWLNMISVFAAIAVIADVVPLVGENRNIYRLGIENIRKGCMTPGMAALVDSLNVNRNIQEGDIGFKIAPLFNAPGRLEDDGAMKSFNLMMADSQSAAELYVDELNDVNELRKRLKAEACERAFTIIEEEHLYGNPILIIDELTPEGILGLVAGAIEEKYGVSAIAMTKKGELYKGSGRAIEADHLKDALDKINELHPGILAGYGGHKGAAGLSIRPERAEEFVNAMRKVMTVPRVQEQILSYDIETGVDKIEEITAEVRGYAPFGEGNPDIIVRVNGFRAKPDKYGFYREMKNGGLKLFGGNCEAVGFNMMEKYAALGYPMCIDIVGKLSYNHFNRKDIPQIEILDFKIHDEVQSIPTPIQNSIMDALKESGMVRA